MTPKPKLKKWKKKREKNNLDSTQVPKPWDQDISQHGHFKNKNKKEKKKTLGFVKGGFEKKFTRAKRRFLGLWNWSQSLSLAKSAIFLLSSSRVTPSSSSPSLSVTLLLIFFSLSISLSLGNGNLYGETNPRDKTLPKKVEYFFCFYRWRRRRVGAVHRLSLRSYLRSVLLHWSVLPFSPWLPAIAGFLLCSFPVAITYTWLWWVTLGFGGTTCSRGPKFKPVFENLIIQNYVFF